MSIGFTPAGDLMTGGSDGGVRRWSPATGALQQTLQASPYGISSLAVRSDGLLAAAGNEGTVRLWDPRTSPPRARASGCSPVDTG